MRINEVSQYLFEHNVANNDDIRAYAWTFTHNVQDQRIIDFIMRVVPRHIINDLDCLMPIDDEQVDFVLAHDIHPKVEQQLLQGNYDDIYWFDDGFANDAIGQKIEHIIHFLNSNLDNPRVMGKLPRWNLETVSGQAEQWINTQGKALAAQGKVEIIHTFEDGHYWCTTTDKDTIIHDGKVIQNCLGQGYYQETIQAGTAKLFILRDSSHRPHVAVLATKDQIKECKGKQNEPVSLKYQDHTIWLLNKKFRGYTNYDSYITRAGIYTDSVKWGKESDMGEDLETNEFGTWRVTAKGNTVLVDGDHVRIKISQDYGGHNKVEFSDDDDGYEEIRYEFIRFAKKRKLKFTFANLNKADVNIEDFYDPVVAGDDYAWFYDGYRYQLEADDMRRVTVSLNKSSIYNVADIETLNAVDDDMIRSLRTELVDLIKAKNLKVDYSSYGTDYARLLNTFTINDHTYYPEDIVDDPKKITKGKGYIGDVEMDFDDLVAEMGVWGSLTITGNRTKTTWPKNIRVLMHLMLRDPSIETLPKSLHFGGDMSTAQKTYKKDTRISDKTNIPISNVETIEDGVRFDKSVNLTGSKVKNIGDNVTFADKVDGGATRIRDDEFKTSSIEKIGKNVKFLKGVRLDSSPLKEIGDGMKITGSGHFYNCNDLIHFPGDVVVKSRDLRLDGCENLESIGDNIKVKRTFSMSGCEKLTSLPPNIEVEDGNLDIIDTGITEIPATIKVGKKIWVTRGADIIVPDNLKDKVVYKKSKK